MLWVPKTTSTQGARSRMIDLSFWARQPADGDLHALVLAFGAGEVPEGAVELVVRVLADRAGVDDDDIRVTVGRADVAGSFEGPAQSLGVVHVHLAAEGAHLVGARGGVQAGFRAGVEQRHGADSLLLTRFRTVLLLACSENGRACN